MPSHILLQVEELEQEVTILHQALSDQKEQEAAMLKVYIFIMFLGSILVWSFRA